MLDSYGQVVNPESFIVRATELSDFAQCRRKWFFQSHNGLNLEPKRKSMKLVFGIAWHSALETYYNTGSEAHAQRVLALKMAEETMKVLDVVSPEYHVDIEQEADEMIELGKQMLSGYTVWSNTQASPKDTDLKIIDTELRLLVPFHDDAYLATRLDAVAVGGTHNLWVFEHKTVSKSTSVDYAPMLQLDFQMGLQLLALTFLKNTDKYAGYSITGSIYNLARKQAPSSRVKSPLFGRHPVFRTRNALTEVAKTLSYISHEMRMAKDDPRKLYHNPHPYAGICSWGCAFKDVCEAMCNGEDYEYILQENFQKREKDIMQTLEEEMGEDGS